MILYEDLLDEISLIETARDSLPSHVHIGALFDLEIRRLRAQAAAMLSPGRAGTRVVRPIKAMPDHADQLPLSLAS